MSVHCLLQGPGDEVSTYDVLMEVETETLTEDAYKVDEFAGNVTLLVEAQVRFPVTHNLKSLDKLQSQGR